MLRRPNALDTDEDILKQQQEFLKANNNDSQRNLKAEEEPQASLPPQNVDHSFGVIGDIVEKNKGLYSHSPPKIKNNEGFPQMFKVSNLPDVNSDHKPKKRSLFARKFNDKQFKDGNTFESGSVVVQKGEKSTVHISNDIHEENVTKLNSMSREEILEEKIKLETSLDPNLIAFLKNRASRKRPIESETMECDEIVKEPAVSILDVKENLIKSIDKEWMDIDVVEPEKLQWIGDIPDIKSLEDGQPYSARFDFSGDLLPFKTEIDVRTSLHHHGEEPERPGYTIQELYQLARSTVLQQRILALNTLANIIRKTKMGFYDSCFDGFLLKKFVESEVFFLLRFAMDDRSITSAAINCIHEFFVNRSDEICLDRLLNVTEEDIEPILYVSIETDNEEDVNELKDHQLLSQDIIRGVLRTDLLVRLNYVLTEFTPDRVAVGKIFEIVVRICRHSVESCEAVVANPSLTNYVFENLQSSQPHHQAIKLIRLLIISSKSIAHDLFSKYNFKFILKILDMDDPVFKLKLECLSLWKSLLQYHLMIDEFHNFNSCLVRLLFFYVEKVNANHGRFDFELFAGIVSTLSVVLKLKIVIDGNYCTALQVCLLKWLTQLTSTMKVSYSLAKGVGGLFRFFTLKYMQEGVNQNDISFLQKLSPILTAFFQSYTFSEIAQNVPLYSNILKFIKVDRDPPNLPSLCSVYKNGDDYAKSVNDNSSLPLLLQVAGFLLKSCEVSHDYKPLSDLFIEKLMNPCKQILNYKPNNSWFNVYEVKLLSKFVELCNKIDRIETIELAFKAMTHFRTDDVTFLKILQIIFSSENLSENLYDIYSRSLSFNFSDTALYSCDILCTDWVFVPIEAQPTQTLSFISKILVNNPKLIADISPTIQYYRLSLVFLKEDNIFDKDIKENLEICFLNVIKNFNELDLNIRVTPDKSFYELYKDLVIQYAATSYGDELFAKFITLPLAQKFDSSFRKLLWSEYMHALRVIILPKEVNNFLSVDDFTNPVDTDESLLVVYLNAATKNVLTEKRNGFVYNLAVDNVKKFLALKEKDQQLEFFLRKRIDVLPDDSLKRKLLGV